MTTPARILALALALGALSLGAAAQVKPDRQDIEVTVVNGQAVVAEEIARTTEGQGAIVWRVQDGYRFADDGIVIEAAGAGKFRCQRSANGQRFRCGKLAHIRGERYKYDVNLVEAGSGRRLPPLDPYIQND